MSGVSKDWETLPQKLFRNILQQGSIPKHVAFILDGNRRYARKLKLKTAEGHKAGQGQFEKTIKWALKCGIENITAYVFSIDNFNRSAEEVNGIMSLLKERIEKILQNSEKMRSEGIRYQFVGDSSLFPKVLKPLIAKVMEETRKNDRLVVNFAFAYTGRNEITSGVGKLLGQMSADIIKIDSLNEALLEKSMQVVPMPPVDLLIRTSEWRLSDFLTWASSDRAVLCFEDGYWPTYSYWKFLLSIFYYQVFRIPDAAKGKKSYLE